MSIEDTAKSSKQHLVAFDFDGTLFSGASPVRLIKKLVTNGIMPVRTGLRIGTWGLRYKMGEELDQSTPRKCIFKSFKHYEARDADNIMCELFEKELKPDFYPQALARVAQHKANGDKIIIASASFEPIISEVAKYIGADGFISTRMEVSNGFYTGKVIGEPPEGLQKIIQFEQLADKMYGEQNWTLSTAYGDHFSDEPLLALASHAVAVNPDRRLARIAKSKNWEIAEW